MSETVTSGPRPTRAPTIALFALLTVVMFVPIRTYAIPSPFSFELEPYRALITILLVGALLTLLATPGLQLRPVRFAVPIGVFVATLLISIVVNVVPLTQQGLVGTAFTGLFAVVFILSVFFLVRQLLSSESIVMSVLSFLVWSGGVISVFAAIERATKFNVFLYLGEVLPLTLLREAVDAYRAGGSRAFGSAQHPIALSVMLCMLVPIALYLARNAPRPKNGTNRTLVYGGLTLLLLLGIACAVSRTAVAVIVVMFVVTLVLRPLVAGGIALLGAPLFVAAAIVSPKTIETTLISFLDVDSLVESQYTSAGWGGAGRLADLGPAFAVVEQSPIFGSGYGSRIVVGPDRNAFIIDNQVLGILMDAGVVGILGLAIFVLAPAIILLRHSMSRAVPDRYRELAFAIGVSIAGYAAAMFFYDAFGFMQTLLVLCVLLAVGAWLLTEAPGARHPALHRQRRAPVQVVEVP